MFKNTNNFFKKVATGNVSQIDINTYIQKVTDNHKLENLKILLKDLEFFIFIYEDEIRGDITIEMIQKRISEYKKNDKEIPIDKTPEIKNIKTGEIIFEGRESYDIEKLFYPYDMFCIRQLRNYVNHLISSKTKQDNLINKHEHIFSNNGFILFEHLLSNYVKSGRGRKSDIAFFYWEMFNDKNHFIHQRPESFKNWFFSTYNNEDLGKLKTYDMVKNPNRIKDYSTALEWFKTLNK